MVQVHHDEGVANRIAPESCADDLGNARGRPLLSGASLLSSQPTLFPDKLWNVVDDSRRRGCREPTGGQRIVPGGSVVPSVPNHLFHCAATRPPLAANSPRWWSASPNVASIVVTRLK